MEVARRQILFDREASVLAMHVELRDKREQTLSRSGCLFPPCKQQVRSQALGISLNQQK